MSRRAGHVCAFVGIAALGALFVAACGPAEASYESNTASASQHAGGEFSPSPGEDDPADDTSISPGPQGPGSADAGHGADVAPVASGDAGASAQPPPAPTPDAGAAPEPPPVGEAPPPEFCEDEVCDGEDNDCDGQVDEGLRNACGECGPLPVEVCDGEDNDCDGQVDEGLRNACGTCGPLPREICNNGRDDDCDGRTDCADSDCGGDCVVTCEEFDGHNCNTDMGYGDHCAPSDNWGGCSPERFWAWCNRRNNTYPNIWDEFLRDWVTDRCDNSVVLTDLDGNGYDEFACTSDEEVLYRCTTPLVVALDPAQPVRYHHVAGAVDFDLSAAGDGSAAAVSWPTAATPWLALDRDGDGRITSGRELFGSATLTSAGLARHGFAALAELDHNRDGRIDAADPLFAELLVWTDDDGDRVSAAHELLPLAWLGVQALGLQVQVQPRCDRSGNCELERSWLRWVDASGQPREGALIDVHLRLASDDPGQCL